MQGLWVSLCGAVGGVISWILAHAAGTNPLNISPWYLAVGSHMLIGAVCAFFVIYFFLPLDMSQFKRVLALSLATGIFWQPVFDGMKRTVAGISNEHTSDELQQKGKELEKEKDPKKISSTIENATNLLLETGKKTKHIDNIDQQHKLEQGVQDVLFAFPKAAEVNPTESYKALSKFGVSSINNDQRTFAMETLKALEKSKPQDCKTLGDDHCKQYKFTIDQIKDAATQKSWSDISDTATQMVYRAPG